LSLNHSKISKIEIYPNAMFQSLQQRDLGFRPESAVDRFYLGNTLIIGLKAGKSANVPR